MNTNGKQKITGFSLIEMLVVVGIFAVVALVSTQSVLLTIRSSRKSESLVYIRQNLDYALSVMERHLHAAKGVTCTSSTTVTYTDDLGTSPLPTFSCVDTAAGGDPGYVASNSARLTSANVDVTGCTFTCPQVTPTPGVPTPPLNVEVSFTAIPATNTGVESATVTETRKILLRSY